MRGSTTRVASRGRPGGRRGWLYAGVGAFLVVDVMLVVWAIGSVSASNEPAAQPREVTMEASSPSPSDGAAADDPGSDQAALTAIPATRLLAAVDSSTAWRATTGACGSALAEPEVSTDAGASWSTTDASSPTGVTALQRLIPSSAEVASFVGLSEDACTPLQVRTFVGGDDYAIDPAGATGSWYLDPSDQSVVISPSGQVDAPCAPVVQLAPRSPQSAMVLCSDSTVISTTDSGGSWSVPQSVAGTVAMTSTDTGWMLAAAGSEQCAGVQIIELSEDLALTERGCLPFYQPAQELSGSVAMSSADDTLWLWTDAGVTLSVDGGVTWR